ncbi:MAG: HAD family phosphatase [Patescibacteria group bacterium]
MKKVKRKLAIFDIDGTLFRSSLLIELVNSLVENKIFPEAAKEAMDKDYFAWINREGSYEEYIWQVINIYQRYIGGWDREIINKIVQRVVDFHKKRVYRFTRDFICELKDENYFLLAISGSPEEIVKKFADYFGFDRAFGSVFEVQEGRFTGKVLYDAAKNKKRILKKFFKDNAEYIDFRESVAVGDTQSDIPIFEAVDYPIVFNPNLDLACYVIKKGWPVIVERKNVIYRLDKFEIANK